MPGIERIFLQVSTKANTNLWTNTKQSYLSSSSCISDLDDKINRLNQLLPAAFEESNLHTVLDDMMFCHI